MPMSSYWNPLPPSFSFSSFASGVTGNNNNNTANANVYECIAAGSSTKGSVMLGENFHAEAAEAADSEYYVDSDPESYLSGSCSEEQNLAGGGSSIAKELRL